MNKQTFLACSIMLLVGCASSTRYFLAEDEMYRGTHFDSWAELGADLPVMKQTIGRIKNLNSSHRSHRDLATKDYQAGNWAYEWDQLAEQAHKHGDHWAATAYYSASAYPFFKADELATGSYKKALAIYEKAATQDGLNLQKLSIPTAKGTAIAYLHLPKTDAEAQRSVVVITNGSDQTLTTLYPFYRDYLSERGWAMISFDLPGIGSNSHIGINTSEVNIIHQALIETIKNDSRLNDNKIALMGSSFGGNAVVKTAFTNPQDIAAAISVCGAVDTPFLNLERALEEVAGMTADAFMDRFDLMQDQIMASSAELALSTHYLGKQKTIVPIMSINHDADDIASLKDMQLTTASSQHGNLVVVEKGTDDGHCASGTLTDPIIIKWLEQLDF